MSNILEQIDKYYLYAISNKKSILLSSSDSKTDLRDIAIKKLELVPDKLAKNQILPKNLIDKYNGLYLYRIKLMKVPKKLMENNKKSNIKMVGGPIVAIIERVQININNKVKLKSMDDTTVNNKIYFSPTYLKKYETIKSDTIDKIAFNYAHDKFNSGLFAVNTINE